MLRRPGVPASAVALAHVDRNPDPGLHAELAARRRVPRLRRLRPQPALARLGAARLPARGPRSSARAGGCCSAATWPGRPATAAYGGMPGLAYLGERVLPRLRADAPTGLVDAVLTTNPARWLTGGTDE